MASVVSRGRGRRRSMNEINMVPFIDVMLVLLIIFMVTAPLISPSVIDVPSVGKAASVPDRVITIEIAKDSKLTIRSRSTGKGPSTDSTLAATLENVALQTLPLIGEARDTPVVISADRTIAYETVVKVMDSLQRAGVQRVGLSVQLVN
ncbi:MAG: protein TolR [Betaproteobacteria bacterium]|nr:protein TolR [Betaproteobacteria bacterium]NDF66093.1 protein TolR [Betaproteobacteria bacterium]